MSKGTEPREGPSSNPSTVLTEIDPEKRYPLASARKLMYLHKDTQWALLESLGLVIQYPPWIARDKGRGIISGSEMIRFLDEMCEMSRPEFLRKEAEFKDQRKAQP